MANNDNQFDVQSARSWSLMGSTHAWHCSINGPRRGHELYEEWNDAFNPLWRSLLAQKAESAEKARQLQGEYITRMNAAAPAFVPSRAAQLGRFPTVAPALDHSQFLPVQQGYYQPLPPPLPPPSYPEALPTNTPAEGQLFAGGKTVEETILALLQPPRPINPRDGQHHIHIDWVVATIGQENMVFHEFNLKDARWLLTADSALYKNGRHLGLPAMYLQWLNGNDRRNRGRIFRISPEELDEGVRNHATGVEARNRLRNATIAMRGF